MFELIQAGENTFYLEAPTHIGIYKDGERAWLIDSGIDKDYAKKALKAIEKIGCSLYKVLNTHSHADHVGGNRYLYEHAGCSFFSDEKECSAIQYPVINTTTVYGAYPPGKFRNDKFFMAKSVPVSSFEYAELPDGFEIISLPGHSIGMTGFRTPDNVVFVGDAVCGEGTLSKYHINYNYDISGYLKSLEELAEIKGELFVPSHSKAQEDMGPLIKLNIDKTAEISELVLNICEKPCSFDYLLKQIFNHYGITMSAGQHLLVGATLRAFLTYLHDDNKINAVICDNEMCYQRA